MAKKISHDLKKKFLIMKAISRPDIKPSMTYLVELSSLSESTVKRHIADLREGYGVSIEYVRAKDGVCGFYRILDYGWINWDRMVTHLYSKI